MVNVLSPGITADENNLNDSTRLAAIRCQPRPFQSESSGGSQIRISGSTG